MVTKSLNIQLYDYTLTISDEVKAFGGIPWSIGRILYTSTRYFPFIDGVILNSSEYYPTQMEGSDGLL